MAYFPQFSNFKDYVQSELNKRRGIRPPGSPLPPDYNATLEVSKLNAWVRLTSGVGDGLVIVSNPNYNLFRASGQGTGIYDGAGGTATIGTTWGDGSSGRSVSADIGGRLRPRPVVTSVEVDEGAGNISRKATISITAFSKEQMEKICEYFLEPGFTVFLEFGWNTSDGVKGLTQRTVADISIMQDFNQVNAKRLASNGQCENYLGYITGGSVSVDGSNWIINVNLTGFTELPFYLQPGPKTKIEKDEEKKGSKTFGTANIFFTKNVAQKRFKQFYNALAPERRTSIVKRLINDTNVVDIKNFINFDDDIKDELNSKTSGTTLFGIVTLNNEEAQTEAGVVEFEAGTKIVGDERFVRLEVLMKVLTAASVNGFKIGNKSVNINFDISNTIIGAFPGIFSLDKSKLFIPNPRTPKFSIEDVLTGGDVGVSGQFTDNSVAGVKFPAQLNRTITQSGNIQKPAQYWGYLKDLYVNLDFFNSIVGTKNFSIKDVLYNLLNGLSSAVNSHWNFQIQEAPVGEGVINLEIVDLNLTSQTDDKVYTFTMSGTDSIFIESSFNMDISGQMMNQIIGRRLGFSAQPHMPDVGIFSQKNDKILDAVSTIRNIETDESPPDPETTDRTFGETVADAGKTIVNFFGGNAELSEAAQAASDEKEAKKKRLSEFLGLIGMYPKVEYIAKSEITNGKIEDYIYRCIYNDSNLLDAQKERRVGNQEYSTLLPIKFSFTIHGISGIQRGDKFNVLGIPTTFYEKGFFQVTAVKHIVDGMMWKTEVEGQFRNRL